MGSMNDEPGDTESLDPDQEILTRVKRHKRDSDGHLSEWRDEARECYGFVAGDHWNEEDKTNLLEMMRVPVVFNRVDPMVQAIAGSEVNNRQTVQYIPRQVGDSAVNEVLSGAADYFRDACDAEDEESDAFMDTVICGLGVTETYLDNIDNPEGMTIIARRDPLSIRYDPSAKKRNLADIRWVQREEWMDTEEIKEKWPDKADDIAASSGGWSDPGDDGTQPHDATFDFLYLKDNTGYDQKTGKLRVIHEQWFELQTYFMALDPLTNQTIELSDDDHEKLKERLSALGIPLQSVKKQRKAWKQAFVCGDVVLEASDVPCNECSYKFITGRRDRNKNTWYGVVKALIDPQKWANKFFSQTLHIINTNAKGGLIVEQSATDNMRKFKTDWSKSDSVTVVNDGALAGGKIMPKPVPNVPVQISQMLQFSISSMRDVSGLNLEILGMADRQQAGVLEAQRKQAALTVLATLFDALRRYRKEQGRLMVKFIRDYLSDGRLIRILGGDGLERYVPLIRDPETLEYDVIVDEASNTVNQKDKTFAILMQMLPTLERMNVPFGPELLEYMPLPTGMIEKWKKMIEERKMQAQNEPPPPQVLVAQANVAKAQASAAKDQAEVQLMPFEQQLKAQELRIQEQELAVREVEANAEIMRAQADIERAQIESLGLGNPAFAGIGRTPSVQ
jgi:Phage P22-like portal protein